jgi:carbamoyl-phosphate synthase large subunit
LQSACIFIFKTSKCKCLVGETSRFDEFAIGRSALQYKVPFVTTLSAALSAIEAIKKLKHGKITVKSLQEYHAEIKLEMTK